MNDQTPLPAPGWYADPAAPETALRYWDGATWTEHVHATAAAGSAPTAAAAEAEQPGVEPTQTAPDTAVPSASPGATAAADSDRAAAEPAGGSPDAPVPPAVPPVQSAPEQRPNPYAPDTAQTAPAAQQPNPYASAPQQPDAPWAQGPGNPYQTPQAPRYGAPAGAPTSRKGLWIGLGIGGGVLLLLVIGLIVAVVAVFAGIRESIRDAGPGPLPSYDLDAPGGEAPELEGEIYGMGEPFVIPDLAGTGEGWEVTVVDFSAEAAEAASAAPGNKAFAVLIETTNLGGVALDPYFAMAPTFVGDDGLEYTDFGMIEPGLIDVDEVEPGATARFTATFEVPEDLDDAGTLLLYDGYMEEYFAVAVG